MNDIITNAALLVPPSPMPEDHSDCFSGSLEELLLVSQKRYEIAIQYADVVLFDYFPQKDQIVHSDISTEKLGLPRIIENPLEFFSTTPLVSPGGVKKLRRMYDKIRQGEPLAQEVVSFRVSDGSELTVKITMTNVFDKSGLPIRAIGVAKDITQSTLLEKETQYGQSLSSGRLFTYEADISTDTVLRHNQNWAEELELAETKSFSQMIEIISQMAVHPSHISRFRAFMSREYILAAFERGETLLTFEYRKKLKDGVYRWYEKTVNTIRDAVTGDIMARCYIVNIDDKKRIELKQQEERKFYEFMVSKAILVYEANITADEAIRGHENWEDLFGIAATSCYSEMIAVFSETAVYPEDRQKFNSMFQLENVKAAFRSGITELYCEYRRPNKAGDLIWVSCTMHLLEDSKTRDLKAFAYVENINTEKLNELRLIFKAEHDELTGFYNKVTTQRQVDAFLKQSASHLKKHAFFLVDIDCFKQVNDNFGHVFGDAILSQVANKIQSLFREDDILGRIGGDEFVVLMKNVTSSASVFKKAQEICDALWESYTQHGVEFHISASTGIAFYKRDGRDYDQLYSHSDSALYAAKAAGRNQFCEYNVGMEASKPIDTGGGKNALLEARPFRENMEEYVFRILYESADKESSINAVLELIGRHYNVSRAYVFEESSDHSYVRNSYEWCNQGIESQIAHLQHVSYQQLGNYKSKFDEQGIFFMASVTALSPSAQKILEPQNVKSMLQFSIMKDNEFCGFVGFDQCGFSRAPSPDEVSSLRNIANIIGVFTTEMRTLEKSLQNERLALSVVNGMSSYAYVCDPNDLKILFINRRAGELAADAQVGDFCYRAFMNRSTPCEECPIINLLAGSGSRVGIDIHNRKLNVWVKSTASWIDWLNGQRVCLVDCVDITQYKQR